MGKEIEDLDLKPAISKRKKTISVYDALIKYIVQENANSYTGVGILGQDVESDLFNTESQFGLFLNDESDSEEHTTELSILKSTNCSEAALAKLRRIQDKIRNMNIQQQKLIKDIQNLYDDIRS